MPSRICLNWTKCKAGRFRNDVGKGLTIEQLAEKYKMGKNTVLSTMKFYGIEHPRPRKKLPEGLEEFVAKIYPNHNYHQILDMVKEKFGRTICRKTIESIAKRQDVYKDEDYIVSMYKDLSLKGHTERQKKCRSPEYRAKQSAAIKELYRSERFRVENGLKQLTKYNIVTDHKEHRQKTLAKRNMICRNNYFGEKGKDILYYDAETKRSKVLESRYRKFFTFEPAEGFDEKDSHFIN